MLASSAGVLGSIPSQGPRHTKDVIKMVPVVVPLFSSTLKREILALSQELRSENKCMDKIWYRNPSKSGSLAVVAGMKKE